MKTNFLFLVILIVLFADNIQAQAQSSSSDKKILIAYFSRSGNTKEIATQIKNATGGDIFEIETVNPYPSEYQAVVDQVKKEIGSNYKPPLKNKVDNMGSYNVIFVGSPIWWSTIAPPVATFLSSYDLSGKTIVPFVTHEGSGLGHSVSDIKKLCPTSTVLEGLPIRGNAAKSSNDDVSKWLREIEILK